MVKYQKTAHKTTIKIRILCILVSCVISFCLLEAVTRLILHHNLTFVERKMASLSFMPSGYCRQIYDPDQLIHKINDRGQVEKGIIKYRINRYGFRGRSIALYKQIDEIRIVILGGSHVFDPESHDCDGNEGWPQIIQENLTDQGYNVRVLNMGVGGAYSLDILNRASFQIRMFSPDIVIFNSEWNDIKWIVSLEREDSPINIPPGALRKNPLVESCGVLDDIMGWSCVYRKIRDQYWKYRLGLAGKKGIIETLNLENRSIAKEIDTGLAQYEVSLRLFVEAVRMMEAIPILAIEERLVHKNNTIDERKRIRYEIVGGHPNHNQLVEMFESCDRVIRKVAKEMDVILFDVNAKVGGNGDCFVDHIHTSPMGSKRIGDEYSNQIAPIINRMVNE